ncbi:MAG: alpha/beta hydrolase [Bacteroidota bacterium]
MIPKKTHCYFVPGLAASKEIFKNIRLPEDQFEIHVLNWLIPEKDESLSAYAQRMAERIEHENPVLLGVSFGGVVAQEMSAFLNLRKLIIVSSVKTKNELPKRLKAIRKTGVYKLVPTGWALSVKDLTKFAIGPRSRKRLKLYQEYLWMRDKVYLDWAIKQMVCWERETVLADIIHIHGDEDVVFPIKNIKATHVLQHGTHIMILNKGSKVSKLLENILESN